MNRNFILIFIFLIFSSLFITQVVASQKIASAESISHSYFNQVNAETKRILFYKWVNKSQSIILTEEFDKKTKAHYQLKENLNYYKKQIGILKVIFNEEIHVIDRINFCNYLQELFSDDEMPLLLIQEQKFLLIQKMVKE